MTRDYLDSVEAQLVERLEQAAVAAPARRRRRELLAIVPAVAAAVAVVAIVVSSVANGPGRGHPTPTQPATGSPTLASRSDAKVSGTRRDGASVAAAAFDPESFTAISEFTWWLLGTTQCASPPCTSIARTEDGGRTFVELPAPHTTKVLQLRFADPDDGFAYGPQLWVTHDGGLSWRELSVGGSVADLAIGRRYAYAIVRTNGVTGKLMRSQVGTNHWTTLAQAGNAYAGLWVHGDEVMLDSASRSMNLLMVSADDGNGFTSHPAPPAILCNFEGSLPVIWAECPTGMLSNVSRSTNDGATFTRPGHSEPGEPNSAAFGAASDSIAVYGYQQLYRTTDGGETWSKVPTPAGITWWQYLAFTDATHGVALGFVGAQSPAHERLYYTTDAGASYHLVPIALVTTATGLSRPLEP